MLARASLHPTPKSLMNNRVADIKRTIRHWAVRSLMFQASQQAGICPLRLVLTGTFKVIRAAIPEFHHLSSEQLPFFGHGCSWRF